MCVICVKEKGVKMPSDEIIRKMWNKNPDGAGYMIAKRGYVFIRKGFMKLTDFMSAIKQENITDDDAVVMHFRIATQGGVNKEMTHPFALSHNLADMKILNAMADIGIAHNGIIQITTDFKNKEYSDTALFITKYLYKLIREPKDFYDKEIQEMIFYLAKSKFAIMNGEGDIQMIGDFSKVNGLYYSNLLHEWDNDIFTINGRSFRPYYKNYKR